MRDGLDDVDVKDVAQPYRAEPDGRPAHRDAGPWLRFAAVVGLVVVLGGVVVLAGGGPDELPATPSTGSAGPEDPARDEGGSDVVGPGDRYGEVREAEEGRPEDGGAGGAAVVPASTVELPEDTYCWWDGVDAEKCDVWAVESARAPFSHVVAAGERVIVAVGDAVVALDGSDGAVLWTWRDVVPEVVDATSDRVFVTDGGGRTIALDAATGTQLWDTPLREGRWLRQSIRDGVVVNREPSSMAVFAADDGELLWERRVPSAVGDGTPVIAEEVIVTEAGAQLVAYSRADGERAWQGPTLRTALPPVYWLGGEVVVAADGDRLVAVEIATGAEVWTRSVEGVEHLADVDADTVAVAMDDRVDLVDRHTGTIVTSLYAPEVGAIQAEPDGGFFSRVGSAGVKLWRTEPPGPAWNLHARMPMYATYATIEAGDGSTYVVAPITDGATVVAFDVSERDAGAGVSVPACDGAQRSWHLGGRTGWAGERVHATVIEGAQPQLLIGIPGVSPTDTSLTVSASPLDTTGQARFSHTLEDWRQELVVDRDGRTADGFPPHWVVTADFPQPGCWELRITGEDVDDTVVIPVPAANDVNG